MPRHPQRCECHECRPPPKAAQQHVDLIKLDAVVFESPSKQTIRFQFPLDTAGANQVCYELLVQLGELTQTYERCCFLDEDGVFTVNLPPNVTAFCVRACVLIKHCRLQVLGTIICCPPPPDCETDCEQRCQLKQVCREGCPQFCSGLAAPQLLCFALGDADLLGATSVKYEIFANVRACQTKLVTGEAPLTGPEFMAEVPADTLSFCIRAEVVANCGSAVTCARRVRIAGILVVCPVCGPECKTTVPLLYGGSRDDVVCMPDVLATCEAIPFAWAASSQPRPVCYRLGFGSMNLQGVSFACPPETENRVQVELLVRYSNGSVEVSTQEPVIDLETGDFQICVPHRNISPLTVDTFCVNARVSTTCDTQNCNLACAKITELAGHDVQCRPNECPVVTPFRLTITPSECLDSYCVVGPQTPCAQIVQPPTGCSGVTVPSFCTDAKCYEFRANWASSQRRKYCRFELSASAYTDAQHQFTIIDTNKGDTIILPGTALQPAAETKWPYVIEEDMSLLDQLCLKAVVTPNSSGCSGIEISDVRFAELNYCKITAQPSLCFQFTVGNTGAVPVEVSFGDFALALVDNSGAAGPTGCIAETLNLQHAGDYVKFWSGTLQLGQDEAIVQFCSTESDGLLTDGWKAFTCKELDCTFLDAPSTAMQGFVFYPLALKGSWSAEGEDVTYTLQLTYEVCFSLPECLLHCLDTDQAHGLLLGSRIAFPDSALPTLTNWTLAAPTVDCGPPIDDCP